MADSDAPPVEAGDRYSVEIEDLGSEGDGVARIGSFVVFVPDVDLGDRVDVSIEEVGGNHATASVVEDGDLGHGESGDGDSERDESEHAESDRESSRKA